MSAKNREFTENLLASIEAMAFGIPLYHASGFRMFLELLREQPLVRSLRLALQVDPGLAEVICRRVEALARVSPEQNEGHNHEAAMAAYTLCLLEVRSSFGKVLGQALTPASWAPWAQKLANMHPQDNSWG